MASKIQKTPTTWLSVFFESETVKMLVLLVSHTKECVDNREYDSK